MVYGLSYECVYTVTKASQMCLKLPTLGSLRHILLNLCFRCSTSLNQFILLLTS